MLKMALTDIQQGVLEIFRAVLRLPELEVSRAMTAKDVKGWTSLTHIRLMVGIEEKFGIRFSAPEIIGFSNYGELLDSVSSKVRAL
jgi:acyl carrier protein